MSALADGRKQLEFGVAASGKLGIIAIDVSRPIRLEQGPINPVDEDQFEALACAQISAYIYERVGKHLEGSCRMRQRARAACAFCRCWNRLRIGPVRTIVDWSLLYVHPDEAQSRTGVTFADAYFRRLEERGNFQLR